MKAFAVLVAALAVFVIGKAQPLVPRLDPKVPFKIQIRHTDPIAIIMMLRGQSPPSPEISTLLTFMALPDPPANNNNSLLPPGKLIYNPGDNTIWFLPDG